MVQNKLKKLRAIWVSGIKLRALNLSGPDLVSDIDIDMSQHFQGAIWALALNNLQALTKF